MLSREETLNSIHRHPEVTVLIAGAGINGAGMFRDLALQGADVLMVDKGDFCAGASAAPSRLIHGGLRYLENGEFCLHAEFTQREILYMAEYERVLHLDDLLLRRTLVALLGQLNRALLEKIADILAEAFEWSTESTRSEIERTLHLLESDHGVRLI